MGVESWVWLQPIGYSLWPISGGDGFAGGFFLRDRSFHEVLAEVPNRTGEFAEIAEDVVESGDKAVDLLFADDEGREDLDDIGVVGGHLGEDAVLLE